MFRRLIETRNDAVVTIVRLVLAGVMFPHGAQKTLGWFGGYGYSATLGFFTGTMHLPWALALLVILIESAGSVLLALGLFGRFAALGIAAVMVGAVVTVHGHVGFFMNWGGIQAGEGFEYHLLAIALALVVMVRGSGAFSMDRVLQRMTGARPSSDAPSGLPVAT
jgi:putative oxidoreductase